MPGRSPGKSTARGGGAKAGNKKDATSKSGSSGKDQSVARKKGLKAGEKTKTKPGGTKTGKKKGDVKKKSTARRAFDFAGPILVALIICVGIAAIYFFPGYFKAITSFLKNPPKVTIYVDRESEKSRGGGSNNGGGPTPSMVYEEYHRLDSVVKKLDQGVYSACFNLNVHDEDINFVEVLQKRNNGWEWEQAVIEIDLPRGTSASNAVKTIRKKLSRMNLKPEPDVKYVKIKGKNAIKVFYQDLLTHTLIFATKSDNRSVAEKVERNKKTDSTPNKNNEKRIPEEAVEKPKVAIIIDDFGQNIEQAECFLSLKFPVTLSVLPFLPHSKDVAELAHKNGAPVMLHLPMQPAGWPNVNPGPGALMIDMGEHDIRSGVLNALKGVPYAVGVNNHMGSKFTEDVLRMGWMLSELKKRNLLYIDSITSTRSRGYYLASKMGVAAGKRSVFLDNVQERQAIKMQLRKLVATARKNGSAIGIGHVYPVTCQVLKSEYNYLNSKVELTPITSIIR